MLEMMQSMNNKNLPGDLIIKMERDLSFFLITYGLFMAFIAFNAQTSTWLFYKTGGFYIASIIFFGLEMVFIRFKVRDK